MTTTSRKAAIVGTIALAGVLAATAPGFAGNDRDPKGKGPKAGGVMGFAWVDADADGVRDEDEARLGGVKVEVYDATGALVGESTSRENGRYQVKKLAFGDYTVKVVAPEGYTVSADQAAGVAVSLKKADPKEKIQIPAVPVG